MTATTAAIPAAGTAGALGGGSKTPARICRRARPTSAPATSPATTPATTITMVSPAIDARTCAGSAPMATSVASSRRRSTSPATRNRLTPAAAIRTANARSSATRFPRSTDVMLFASRADVVDRSLTSQPSPRRSLRRRAASPTSPEALARTNDMRSLLVCETRYDRFPTRNASLGAVGNSRAMPAIWKSTSMSLP